MTYLTAVLLLLTGLFSAQAQEFRLSYDDTTIPELYYSTDVYLEQKVGSGYEPYSGKYRIFTDEAVLKGRRLTYDLNTLRQQNGKIRFTVQLNEREIPLSLSLPVLTELRFNPYTDSIKPVLNYYVNVEGVYSSGRIFPLTEDQVTITSNAGTMYGMEWKPPGERNFDKVTFTAVSKSDPSLRRSVTLYLKKYADPRDADGYEEQGIERNSKRR